MKSKQVSKKMSYSSIKKSIFTQISKAQFDQMFQNPHYIGSGMQGEVYKATNGDTYVAIKYFRKQFIGVQYISYIQSEIQTLSQCDNENIIKFIDSYQVILGPQANQKKYCIVTEYCQESLISYHLISPLSNLQKLKMCLGLISGVKAAHQKGIIHRDIKPENILIKDFQTWTVKLADFGCCRLVSEEEVSMTKNVGTPIYADPNINLGKYTNKCDVYSVGLVIVYIFCGKHYFSECDTREKLINQKKKFCQSTEKMARIFLRQYELQEEIKQFLIQIAFLTLPENEDKRLSSKALCDYIEQEIINYQNAHPEQIPSKPQVKASFSKNSPIKSESKVSSIIQPLKENDLMPQSPIKNLNQSQVFDNSDLSVSILQRSEFSEKISRQTTDRLTEELSSAKKSSQKENSLFSHSQESDSSFSVQNLNFGNSKRELTSRDIAKNQEKVNQSQFIKKSHIKEQTQPDQSSKFKSKNQIFANRPSEMKYNSSMTFQKRISTKEKSKSFQRNKKIEAESKQISQSQKLCAQMIKYNSECALIVNQCESMLFLTNKLQANKVHFQSIKKIEKIHLYSMTFEQKETLAFLSHCFYAAQLKDFMNFLYGGTSKLFARLEKISQDNKEVISQIVEKEAKRIFTNLKSYAGDLKRKVSLIKPRLSTMTINLINEVTLCGQYVEVLSINLQQDPIKAEMNSFINEKIRDIKNQEDIDILQGLRSTMIGVAV